MVCVCVCVCGVCVCMCVCTCPSVLEGEETNEIHHKPSDRDEHESIVVDSRGLKGTLHTNTNTYTHTPRQFQQNTEG